MYWIDKTIYKGNWVNGVQECEGEITYGDG